MPHAPGVPGGFPPLERVGIERLACCEPAGIGLHLTHWSTRRLAQAAMAQGLVPHIAHSTVSLILRTADLQPHRVRYWKTPTLDEAFRSRAARVLWCYEQAARLAGRGEWVLCLDEKPNLQALERAAPTRPLRAHQVQRQEFEYYRHGTVNFLVALEVATGRMYGWCLAHNDSASLCEVLPTLFRHYRRAKRLHLIWDNGPSHIATDTQDFLHQFGPAVRPLFTPAHASWLNQAELLLHAFTARYLTRGEWASQQALIAHLLASTEEYNRHYAHPFEWTWTRRHMHAWLDAHRQ